jgi:hypothetical protein
MPRDSYVAGVPMRALMKATRRDAVRRRSTQLRMHNMINYVKVLRRCVKASRVAVEVNKALRCRKIKHSVLSFTSNNVALLVEVRDALFLLRQLNVGRMKYRREVSQLLGNRTREWCL